MNVCEFYLALYSTEGADACKTRDRERKPWNVLINAHKPRDKDNENLYTYAYIHAYTHTRIHAYTPWNVSINAHKPRDKGNENSLRKLDRRRKAR